MLVAGCRGLCVTFSAVGLDTGTIIIGLSELLVGSDLLLSTMKQSVLQFSPLWRGLRYCHVWLVAVLMNRWEMVIN